MRYRAPWIIDIDTDLNFRRYLISLLNEYAETVPHPEGSTDAWEFVSGFRLVFYGPRITSDPHYIMETLTPGAELWLLLNPISHLRTMP